MYGNVSTNPRTEKNSVENEISVVKREKYPGLLQYPNVPLDSIVFLFYIYSADYYFDSYAHFGIHEVSRLLF
jgi:hypothetical protein